ncbi:dihydrodipicolinate reductase C-terminal domain-containing protein [Streptomyces sp. NPDC088707]|uniref:dihydrodipicolinate reductase C-terminal domain-containing protein n=1 Tax=Streptomyces sp. NPDC088707 TaxID=3365871 RepID=UPI0038158269
MPETAIGVFGTGRLARAVHRLATEEGLTAHLLDPRRPEQWDTVPPPGVLVDCSAPEAVAHAADLSARLDVPLVECVSGLDEHHLRVLEERAAGTVVVLAPNLSLGNYLQTRALRLVADVVTTMDRAGITGAVPEAAVLERHPAAKRHRPSTTASRLARQWLRHTGRPAADVASLRCGPAVSDHEVRLTWPEQTLTLTHRVDSLDAAAAGAIGAAQWAAGHARGGTYTIHQVFDDLLATMAARTADDDDREDTP